MGDSALPVRTDLGRAIETLSLDFNMNINIFSGPPDHLKLSFVTHAGCSQVQLLQLLKTQLQAARIRMS